MLFALSHGHLLHCNCRFQFVCLNVCVHTKEVSASNHVAALSCGGFDYEQHLSEFLCKKGIPNILACPCVLNVADVRHLIGRETGLCALAALLFESIECRQNRCDTVSDCPMKGMRAKQRKKGHSEGGLFSFVKQCCKGRLAEKVPHKEVADMLDHCLCVLCGFDMSSTLIRVQFWTSDSTVERECLPAHNNRVEFCKDVRHVCLPVEESGAVVAVTDKSVRDVDTAMFDTSLFHVPMFHAVVMPGDVLQSQAFRMQNSVHGNACLCFSLSRKDATHDWFPLQHMQTLDACITSGNVPLHCVIRDKTLQEIGVFAFGRSQDEQDDKLQPDHNERENKLQSDPLPHRLAAMTTNRKATIRGRCQKAAVLQHKLLAESFFKFVSWQGLWGQPMRSIRVMNHGFVHVRITFDEL